MIGTLGEVCDGSFARAISTITPELIARLGAKWHGAHNKAAAANVMRNAVIALDLNGLAASYDDLAAADKKMEIEVVTRMLRSGQHAARQHRERTGTFRSDPRGQRRAARRQAQRFWGRGREAHHGSEEASGISRSSPSVRW